MQRFTGTHWSPGDVILGRQILKGQVWGVFPEYVVEDSGDRLVTFIQTGSQFGFPDVPDGFEIHPWKVSGRTHWTGHGSLAIQREGEPWSVSVFWRGPDREFDRWYIDLAAPFVRFDGGVDGLDQELDLEVGTDGVVHEKDVELFEERVEQGRYSTDDAVQIRANFRRVRDQIRRDGVPVEPEWATWEPPSDWGPLALPDNWRTIAPPSVM